MVEEKQEGKLGFFLAGAVVGFGFALLYAQSLGRGEHEENLIARIRHLISSRKDQLSIDGRTSKTRKHGKTNLT